MWTLVPTYGSAGGEKTHFRDRADRGIMRMFDVSHLCLGAD